MKIWFVVAVLLLAGCTSETPLDPAVGKVLVRKHVEGYEDCDYSYRYDPGAGEFRYLYGCDWHPSEWTFAVAWEAQRFQDDDTKKVRTEQAHTESGYQTTEEAYDDCKEGEWLAVTGEAVACTEGRP